MNYAICWNHLLSIPTTRFVSGMSPISNNVGMGMQSAGNQRRHYANFEQVKANDSLVGAPETTRVATEPIQESFCEWLAGVIDGDGYLYVKKGGFVGLEITMDYYDEPCLTTIKTRFGGSIKRRSGSKSYRYRTQSRDVMILIINAINGHIRNSVRIPQLQAVCKQLGIEYKVAVPLTHDSHWFAGFWDADGTITYSMKLNGNRMLPQLSVRVSQKMRDDLEPILSVFGGSIYYAKSQNGHWQWSIQSREDIFNMVAYFMVHKPRSHKFKRILLVDTYFHLRDLKAYESNSFHHGAWEDFNFKWDYCCS